MITKLELENWRGIKRGVIEGFQRINVLVGRNNSGKSSVLEAILLFNLSAEKLLLQRRPKQGWIDFIFIGQQNGARVKVHTIWGTAERLIKADGASPVMVVGNFSHSKLMATFDKVVLIDDRQLSEPNLDEWYSQLLAREQRLDKEWIRLVNETYGLCVEYLTRMKFPTFPTGESPERLVAVLGEPENRAVAVEWLGDGVRLGMTILASGLATEGGIMLLEEPENHQHPSALFALARSLVKLSQEHGNQIFTTTHSREWMQALLKAATELEFVGALKFFHLQILPDGNLWVRSLDAPDAQVLEDIGYDLRFDYEFARLPQKAE
jgi:hypothetical protein